MNVPSPDLHACGRCQRTSPLGSHFSQVYSFAGPRRLCPHCTERRRLRRSRISSWMLGAAAAVALLLLVAGARHDGLWIVLAFATFIVASHLSVLPHEFGHALAARAVGYQPLAILWGSTRTFFDRRIFGIRTLIGQAPQGGVTFYDPTDDRWPRFKNAVITAAGPATNLLIAGLSFAVAAAFTGPQEHPVLRATLFVIGAANILLALGNLWPAETVTVVGTVPNDGMRLLGLLRNTQPLDLAGGRAAASQLRMYFAYVDEAHEQVLGEADAAEKLLGPALWIEVSRSAALCALSQPARAREVLERGRRLANPDPASMVLAQNNLAWANFLLDDPALDEDSVQRSALALDAMPWLPPVVITRACVLAASSGPASPRLLEARRLLDGLHEFHLDKKARTFAAVARGLIAAAEGAADDARRELEHARSIGDPGLAGRVLEARLPSC